jgi:prepilin-type N-terminal cleavage/methylation domain-containing protein
VRQCQSQSWCRPVRAFNLTELAVVVVIIGILAGIALPRYADAVATRRLDAAARRLVVDLSLSRSRARTSSTSQTVAFDVNADRYELVGMDHPDRAGEKYSVHLSDEPYQAKIVSVQLGGDAEIVFDGFGMPDTGGTIVIQVGGYQKTVIVDALTGQASVQ